MCRAPKIITTQYIKITHYSAIQCLTFLEIRKYCLFQLWQFRKRKKDRFISPHPKLFCLISSTFLSHFASHRRHNEKIVPVTSFFKQNNTGFLDFFKKRNRLYLSQSEILVKFTANVIICNCLDNFISLLYNLHGFISTSFRSSKIYCQFAEIRKSERKWWRLNNIKQRKLKGEILTIDLPKCFSMLISAK